MGIGIPYEQKKLTHKNFGQLAELEVIIRTLREENQLQNKIIHHIQYIYEKILEAHNNNGYVSQYWMKKHLDDAKRICSLVLND